MKKDIIFAPEIRRAALKLQTVAMLKVLKVLLIVVLQVRIIFKRLIMWY